MSIVAELTGIEGYESWQMVFLAISGAFLTYKLLAGWRIGALRKFLTLMIYPVAGASVWYFSTVLSEFTEELLPIPDSVRIFVAGVVIFLTVLLVSKLLISLFISKTGDYDHWTGKTLSGIGGALLGGLIAGFWVILIMVGVRFGSNWLEGYYEHQKEGAFMSGAATYVVAFENSLGLGTVGNVLAYMDPVGEQSYRIAGKLGQVSSRKDAIVDLASHKDIDPDSVFMSLFSDKTADEVEVILDDVLKENQMN